MRTLGAFVAALCLVAAPVWAIEQSSQSLVDVKVFRNVSGATQSSGTAYVLQEASTDSNIVIGEFKGSDSTLGMDVTTIATADSDDFVGIQVDDSCLDDALCRVIVWGPALAKWAGATDNTNTRLADVGTTTVAGRLGSGTLAGTLLSLTVTQTTAGGEAEEINGQTDNENRWVWVQPQNN